MAADLAFMAEEKDAQTPPFTPTHHLRDGYLRFTEFLLRNVEEWNEPHALWPPPPPPIAFSGSDRFIKGRLPHRTLAISASLASLLSEAATPLSDVGNHAHADRASTLASVENMPRGDTQFNLCETTLSDDGSTHTLSTRANTSSHVFSAPKSDINCLRSQADDSAPNGVVDGCGRSADKSLEVNADCMRLVDSYPVSANERVDVATCSTVSLLAVAFQSAERHGDVIHECDPSVQPPGHESRLPSTQQGGRDCSKELHNADMICLHMQYNEGCPRLSENSLDTLKGANVAIEAPVNVEVGPSQLLESKNPLLPSGQIRDEQEEAKLCSPSISQCQDLSRDMGGIPDLSASCTTNRLAGDVDGEVEVPLPSAASMCNNYALMDLSDSVVEQLPFPSKGRNDNSITVGASLLFATKIENENRLGSDANGSAQLSLPSLRKSDKVNNIACDSDYVAEISVPPPTKSHNVNVLQNTVVEASVILGQAEQIDDDLEEGELSERLLEDDCPDTVEVSKAMTEGELSERLLEDDCPDTVEVSKAMTESEMQEEAEGHPADAMELVVKCVESITDDDEMDQPLSLFISRYRTRSSVKLSTSKLSPLHSSKDCNKTRNSHMKRKIEEQVLKDVTGSDMAVTSNCKPVKSVVEGSRKVPKTCANGVRKVNQGDLSDVVGEVFIVAKVNTSEAKEVGLKQAEVGATQPGREQVMGTSDVVLSEWQAEPTHGEELRQTSVAGKKQSATCEAVVARKKSRRGGSAEHRRKRQQKKHKKAQMLGTGKLRLKSCLDKPKEKKDCHFYLRGQCEKGASCQFSHAATPRTKSELCKYHVNNCCLKGDDCPFSHALSTFPCKFFHMRGSCLDAGTCRFSHEPLSEEAKQKLLKRVAEEQHGHAEQHVHAENKMTVGGVLGHVSSKHAVPPSDLELFPLGGKHVHKAPLKGKGTPARNISVVGTTGITSIQTDRPLRTAAFMLTAGRTSSTPTYGQNRPSPHKSSEKSSTPSTNPATGRESGGPLLSSYGNITTAQERKAKVDGFLQSQLDNSSLMRKAKLGTASESTGGFFTSLRQSKALSMGPTSLLKPSNLSPSGKLNTRVAELCQAFKECNQLELTSKGANCPNAVQSSGFDIDRRKSVANDRSREMDASVSKPAALGPSLLDMVSMSQKVTVPRGPPASIPGSLSMAIQATPKQSTANMILDRFLK